VLTWGASADASTVVYEVLRGDRVVATTTASTYTVPITAEPTPYVVRARDAAGNRSAGTAAFVVQPPARSALTFIGDRDTWAWRYSAAAIGEDWTTAAYDDSSWHVGAAPFGAGVSGAATSINRLRSAGRPLSAQFRKAFEVRNAATVSDAVVSVIADDGAVVYLNGREIGRVRMPEGAVTQTSLATETVSPSTAAGARAVIVVPQGTLVDGPNILAVSVHTGDKEKPNMGFDLAFTAARAAPPKAVTGLSATSTADTVTLTWSASDGTAPASYVVRRDGTQVGTTTAPTVTFADGDLAASATHHYTVVAVAADGQTSPTASVQASTTADQPVIVPNGSVWSWRSSDEPLPGGWNALGFDSSGWASGPGVLGRGFGAATDIDPSRLRTKPVSAQFRHAFTVTHPASVKDGTVSVIADDGVVVYLNGVELGRSRLPGGAIGQNTVATGSTGARAAASHRVTFAVPARLLTKGTNVLAASVHANYRATPDLSFDLSLKMARG
jgi:hypothetical protein